MRLLVLFSCFFVSMMSHADRGPVISQTCGIDTVRENSVGRKLRPRPNPEFVLLGSSILARFDTETQQKVHYYHRTVAPDSYQFLPSLPELMPYQVSSNWREYKKTREDARYTAAPNNMAYIQQHTRYLGSDSGNFINGHTKKRFQPSSIGSHDIIALFTKPLPSHRYTSNLYFSDIADPVGFFCVVHRFYVHSLPTLTETSLYENVLPNGLLHFKAVLKGTWARFSEAELTQWPLTIKWERRTLCLDSGNYCNPSNASWQYIREVNNNAPFELSLLPGRYVMRATISDGVSEVIKTYPIEHSSAVYDDPVRPINPPCERCAIP